MRTHDCRQICTTPLGTSVTLAGWVAHHRDLGERLFIVLRDHTGECQLIFQKGITPSFEAARGLTLESCISVTGTVKQRPDQQGIELHPTALHCFSMAAPLPIHQHLASQEEVRLRYRYLELRRPQMQAKLRCRARIHHYCRHALQQAGFLEVETPLLTRATPEGARDYIVPSRVHPGRCYALPQSPQLSKQLLMISGMDRYYQIARCFRDEDLRADRQPEFTQLDIETSFLSSDALRALIEPLIRGLWIQETGVTLPPFPVLTYREAMTQFGSDKPDLRMPQSLVCCHDLLPSGAVEPQTEQERAVVGLRLPAPHRITRGQKDCYSQALKAASCSHLRVLPYQAGALEGISLSPTALEALITRAELQEGDHLLLASGPDPELYKAMGALRLTLGAQYGLIDLSAYRPLWVIHFPLFERSITTGCLESVHHPFTAPLEEQQEQLQHDPCQVLSDSYDLVMNGYELGGGSRRIIDPHLQQTIFSILGIAQHEQQTQFGTLLEALRYGPPPHAGIAFGLDRIAMLLTGASSIREVIAFPKTASAHCPLTDAPSLPSPQGEALLEAMMQAIRRDDGRTQ